MTVEQNRIASSARFMLYAFERIFWGFFLFVSFCFFHMPALSFSLCLFEMRSYGIIALFDKDSHQRWAGGSCLCCFPCRVHISFPPSPLSLVLQCSVSAGCKPKPCPSLLALGRSRKTLGPSLIAAAVCLHAPGEKAKPELQGRIRVLLLRVSIVLLWAR